MLDSIEPVGDFLELLGLVLLDNVSACVRSQPILQRVFAKNFWIEGIGVAGSNDRMKNPPDRVAIVLPSQPNINHA